MSRRSSLRRRSNDLFNNTDHVQFDNSNILNRIQESCNLLLSSTYQSSIQSKEDTTNISGELPPDWYNRLQRPSDIAVISNNRNEGSDNQSKTVEDSLNVTTTSLELQKQLKTRRKQLALPFSSSSDSDNVIDQIFSQHAASQKSQPNPNNLSSREEVPKDKGVSSDDSEPNDIEQIVNNQKRNRPLFSTLKEKFKVSSSSDESEEDDICKTVRESVVCRNRSTDVSLNQSHDHNVLERSSNASREEKHSKREVEFNSSAKGRVEMRGRTRSKTFSKTLDSPNEEMDRNNNSNSESSSSRKQSTINENQSKQEEIPDTEHTDSEEDVLFIPRSSKQRDKEKLVNVSLKKTMKHTRKSTIQSESDDNSDSGKENVSRHPSISKSSNALHSQNGKEDVKSNSISDSRMSRKKSNSVENRSNNQEISGIKPIQTSEELSTSQPSTSKVKEAERSSNVTFRNTMKRMRKSVIQSESDDNSDSGNEHVSRHPSKSKSSNTLHFQDGKEDLKSNSISDSRMSRKKSSSVENQSNNQEISDIEPFESSEELPISQSSTSKVKDAEKSSNVKLKDTVTQARKSVIKSDSNDTSDSDKENWSRNPSVSIKSSKTLYSQSGKKDLKSNPISDNRMSRTKSTSDENQSNNKEVSDIEIIEMLEDNSESSDSWRPNESKNTSKITKSTNILNSQDGKADPNANTGSRTLRSKSSSIAHQSKNQEVSDIEYMNSREDTHSSTSSKINEDKHRSNVNSVQKSVNQSVSDSSDSGGPNLATNELNSSSKSRTTRNKPSLNSSKKVVHSDSESDEIPEMSGSLKTNTEKEQSKLNSSSKSYIARNKPSLNPPQKVVHSDSESDEVPEMVRNLKKSTTERKSSKLNSSSTNFTAANNPRLNSSKKLVDSDSESDEAPEMPHSLKKSTTERKSSKLNLSSTSFTPANKPSLNSSKKLVDSDSESDEAPEMPHSLKKSTTERKSSKLNLSSTSFIAANKPSLNSSKKLVDSDSESDEVPEMSHSLKKSSERGNSKLNLSSTSLTIANKPSLVRSKKVVNSESESEDSESESDKIPRKSYSLRKSMISTAPAKSKPSNLQTDKDQSKVSLSESLKSAQKRAMESGFDSSLVSFTKAASTKSSNRTQKTSKTLPSSSASEVNSPKNDNQPLTPKRLQFSNSEQSSSAKSSSKPTEKSPPTLLENSKSPDPQPSTSYAQPNTNTPSNLLSTSKFNPTVSRPQFPKLVQPSLDKFLKKVLNSANMLPPNELRQQYPSLQDFDKKHGPTSGLSTELKDIRLQLLLDPTIMQQTKQNMQEEYAKKVKGREDALKKKQAEEQARKAEEKVKQKRIAKQERERKKQEREARAGVPALKRSVYAPRHWCTKKLYKYLEAKLEPKHKLTSKMMAEKVMRNLVACVDFVIKAKKYDDYKVLLGKLKRMMARNMIVETHEDFYFFCYEFLPYKFRVKAVPMFIPGQGLNVPDYDPKEDDLKILES